MIFFIILTSYIYCTFSITAVNIHTHEVGSAGGSCIANSIIISDIHPGVGVIHTQSYWNSANQTYASDLMDQGFSPLEIINLLEENDVSNNPTIRQYGITDIFPGINQLELNKNQDYRLQIGGPILRDRLFFFVNYKIGSYNNQLNGINYFSPSDQTTSKIN